MEEVKRCPRCSAEEVVPVVYGPPSSEMVGECRRGEVALGGCTGWPDAPDYLCQNCGHEWREDKAGS
jgi:hypothetical protein